MARRPTRFSIAAGAVAALWLAASAALAQPANVTKDEFKCQSGTGKTLAKFLGARSKCAQKCLAAARKVPGPYTGCFAPYADPAVNACIFDSLKGADAKARAAIVKACGSDCPECYDPNVCTTGDPFLTNSASQLNLFGPLVYCLEGAATTPTKAEAKCEDTVGKTLAKFAAAKTKCYSKCNAAIFKGTLSEGVCTPPVSDVPTQDCISAVEDKAAAAIDKACSGAGANPACYVPATDTGAEWVALTELAVDATVPDVACIDP